MNKSLDTILDKGKPDLREESELMTTTVVETGAERAEIPWTTVHGS